MLSQWLLTSGLSCDVLGAIFVFTFALGPKVSRGGVRFLSLEGEDTTEAAKARRYEAIGRLGGLLIILGFALQIWSVWV